jgi:hypothetical protein
LLTLVATAHADPVAVLAAFKGKVTVASAKGGEAAKAAFGRSLENGDRVVTGPGGSVSIFFNDGNVIELGEKSSMTVGGRVAARSALGVEKLPGEVFAQVARYSAGGSRQTGMVALSTLRSGGAVSGPEPLAPRNTDVLDARPALSWRPVEGAARYRVSMSGDAGELWSRETSATTLAFPDDAAALAADADYLWEVQAFSASAPLGKASTTFHLAPAAQAQAVRGVLARIREGAGGDEKPAARFLSGSYLFGRGFYQDAGTQFEALSRLSPESPAPHEALGNVYRAVGLMDLAAASFERALSLSREP